MNIKHFILPSLLLFNCNHHTPVKHSSSVIEHKIAKRASIEYTDLIEIFSLPKDAKYNVQYWKIGKDQKAIKWLKKSPKTTELDPITKAATVNLTVDGHNIHEDENIPANEDGWDIEIYGAEDGINRVTIQTGMDAGNDYIHVLPDLLQKHGFVLNKLLCGQNNTATEFKNVYQYSSSKVKGYLYYWISCGMHSCTEEATIFYDLYTLKQFDIGDSLVECDKVLER